MKQPIKDLYSDLRRPTMALFCSPTWGMEDPCFLLLLLQPQRWVKSREHLPGPPTHGTPLPQCFTPIPQIAACCRGACFLCPFSIQTEGSSGATEKMKKGLSDFLGVISDTFAPSPDKTIDCDVITLMGTPSGTAEPYDGTKVFTDSLPYRCLTSVTWALTYNLYSQKQPMIRPKNKYGYIINSKSKNTSKQGQVNYF